MSATGTGHDLTRRRFLGYFSAIGLSSTLLPGVLWSQVQDQQAPRITREMLQDAERVAGLEFTDEERDLMLEGLNDNLQSYETLRTIPLSNDVPPALYFNPIPPGGSIDRTERPFRWSPTRAAAAPADIEQLAFRSVAEQAALLESRQLRSVDLTRMYLDRLKRYGPRLECVVTLTEELAMRQARQADEEIAAGRYRGPLHGIPWGAKDLLSVPGYRTTWGAVPFRDQLLERTATVAGRLERAGAVLVAKLALGALAWGDVWYGGRTRNPWNYEQGSSGSSAGPAAATAAGLVGFSIGSETWGSIVSPASRCGATGLRPTFGRVSRYGAMALSWSMDKLGPICRTVEDCALVLEAIRGPDGLDLSVIDVPFGWGGEIDIRQLRIGYLQSAFEADRRGEGRDQDLRTLDALSSLGLNLIPIELPDLPVGAMSFILNTEAAAAFDDLTLSNRDDLMVRQIRNAWPNVFRQSHLVPAVEYLQANRVRTLLIERMAELMSRIDLYVAPSFGGDNLLLTNLTGHPCIVLPNGFRQDGTPTSISFIGRLFGETEMLTVARAYQESTGFQLRHPRLQP